MGEVNTWKCMLVLIVQSFDRFQLSETQIKGRRKRRSLHEVRVLYFCYLLSNCIAYL